MTTLVYNNAKKLLTLKSVDFLNDVFKMMLVTGSYVPNQDTDVYLDDITANIANEVAGTGYTQGGATLTNVTSVVDTVNNRCIVDADDVIYPALVAQMRGAVIYKSTGDPSTSPLILYLDFGEVKVSNGGQVTIQLASTGFLKLQ